MSRLLHHSHLQPCACAGGPRARAPTTCSVILPHAINTSVLLSPNLLFAQPPAINASGLLSPTLLSVQPPKMKTSGCSVPPSYPRSRPQSNTSRLLSPTLLFAHLPGIVVAISTAAAASASCGA
eukprot:1151952-Pelagomonas_calceolata.AAC.5